MCDYLIRAIEVFFNPSSLVITVPIVAAIIAYLLNEKSKRRWEEYQRKEESYKKLIIALKGFYKGSNDDNLKQEFIDQANIAWLYLPDNIIRKIYHFIDTVHTDSEEYTDKDRTKYSNELIYSLRKDLISRKRLKKTNLTASDYKHLTIKKVK